MKINVKLISSFGTVLIATLAVFGTISYSTIAESTRQNSDRIITLQSSEIIYQTTKTFNKQVRAIEQQLASTLPSNTCSPNSEAEIRALLTKFASQNSPFLSISLYHFHGGAIPPEFKTWLDEINKKNSYEPVLRRQSDSLFLLWPTQTAQGRAMFVITLDQTQLAATLRSYLRIDGAAIILSDNDQPILSPIPQDRDHSLDPGVLNTIDTNLPSDRIEKTGEVFTYRPSDKLFGANLTLVVPQKFYQAKLISLKNRIITAMLIVGWVSVWTLLIIAYKISSPIKKLSEITKDIIAFNYSTELEITPSNDEIGELAENFEKMRQKIKSLVTMDPLTQIYNRHFMMHTFELEVFKAIRKQCKLCCILMDLDHFKQINDTYGHQGGDAVLVAVGKTLLEISRNYDTPARYGGEEFILILPETSLDDAHTIAERIRNAVQQMVIDFEGAAIRCTMSMGLAELDIDTANTTDKIINNADKALYQAKREGRDQVVVYEPPAS
jgi:diguanylate cyclase (GGDEF)-like protein